MVAIRLWAVGAFVAALVAISGCGETVIDAAKTEDTIQHDLESSTGRKVSAVDCPSGIEVEKGASFQCTVSLQGGKREVATLKIRNGDADLSLVSLQPEEKSE